MDKTVNVTLLQPAKVGGVLRMPGRTVAVTQAQGDQLVDAGAAVRSGDVALADTPLGADFDQALASGIAEREALWSTAMDHFETMAEDEKAALRMEVDNLQAKLTAEGEAIAALQDALLAAGEKIATLENQIAAAGKTNPEGGDQGADGKPASKKSAKEVRS
ncbi:MAG: hypothetical protein K0M55_06970 [Rhizobium sp.]|nr:hypothetical protein [Rhizobium sp.]